MYREALGNKKCSEFFLKLKATSSKGSIPVFSCLNPISNDILIVVVTVMGSFALICSSPTGRNNLLLTSYFVLLGLAKTSSHYWLDIRSRAEPWVSKNKATLPATIPTPILLTLPYPALHICIIPTQLFTLLLYICTWRNWG